MEQQDWIEKVADAPVTQRSWRDMATSTEALSAFVALIVAIFCLLVQPPAAQGVGGALFWGIVAGGATAVVLSQKQ